MAERKPLRKLTPESLTERQRAVHAEISGGSRAHGPQSFPLLAEDGSLVGPFNAFLLQPRLGHALQAVGGAIRYETSLTDRVREIAILLVASHEDSAFERYSHELIARQVGLSDDEIAALRDCSTAPFADEQERTAADAAVRLLRAGDLPDELYVRTMDVLGEAALFELLTLVGYYRTLALQMRVFRVEVPDDTDKETP